ncbi:MAG: glycosyltransferase family 39 protein [Gomphosphaeria aponina SAG 52.96 = DSM 107014]|uniref:Glycosyltransferase family 39 protein n=1 Tax=Gomphosphaeria aponina SAG 52.96 = DSM 107014 TaxID=1521640 RepID=A0A941GPP6_9CHRO|nr:glycosyltransferase family 39 protein [Gomphosphaeria aponina SAG 52.96 = DSM 107014]
MKSLKPVGLISLFYLGSRLIFFLAGVRLDLAPLDFYMHYIDPELLKHNLVESLFYLHSQPPLFNLFLGIILKLFPNHSQVVFSLCYLLFGLTLVISLFLLMSRLGINQKLARILTILFMISPAYILNENWLFYDYPVTSLLCLSSLFLFSFMRKNQLWQGGLFFTILAIICLTRSLFHLSYFIILITGLAWVQRFEYHQVRKLLLAALLPLSLIFLLFLKNYLVFGNFSASSWLGFNLAKTTQHLLSDEEKATLVGQGKLSELTLIGPGFISSPWRVNINSLEKITPEYTYSPLTELKSILPEYEKTGIPMLDEEYKSTGYVNYHHLAYQDISKKLEQDAWYIIRIKPVAYLQGRFEALMSSWLRLNSDYLNKSWASKKNFAQVKPWQGFYTQYFCGRFLPFPVSIVFYLILPFYGCYLIVRQQGSKVVNLPFVATIFFLVVNIFWVTLTSHLLVDNEQERVRLLVEPFYLVLFGLLLQQLFAAHPKKRLRRHKTTKR